MTRDCVWGFLCFWVLHFVFCVKTKPRRVLYEWIQALFLGTPFISLHTFLKNLTVICALLSWKQNSFEKPLPSFLPQTFFLAPFKIPLILYLPILFPLVLVLDYQLITVVEVPKKKIQKCKNKSQILRWDDNKESLDTVYTYHVSLLNWNDGFTLKL